MAQEPTIGRQQPAARYPALLQCFKPLLTQDKVEGESQHGSKQAWYAPGQTRKATSPPLVHEKARLAVVTTQLKTKIGAP